ncbi:N-acyl-D-glutamate deacylase [bacterium HR33]|nr:N-acyl-D-glutamate deacylase [bacterium HR33]
MRNASTIRATLRLVLPAVLLWGTAPAQQSAPYDVVIKNGMILDGTGNPFFIADVAIRGERIAEIGTVDATRARRVIDAKGMYVTPGFIDMHSHSGSRDGAILHPEGRKALNSITQGITTEAINPPWPVAEQIAKYRAGGFALNEVVSVNFGEIREMVMGLANRPPTAAELERMKNLIKQGFREGARYVFVNLENGIPDRFALTDELVEIAKTVSELQGYYDTHQRSEGITPIWYHPSEQDHNPASHSPVVDGIEAVHETIEIAERSGARVVGHHVKVKGPNFWGASRAYVQLMDRARARGVQVYFSIYGYTSYGNWPNVAVIPQWALVDPDVPDPRILRGIPNPYRNARRNLQRVLADSSLRRSLLVDIEHEFTKAGGPQRLLLVEYPDPRYAGKTLQEIADLRNEDPVETLIWLQLNGDNRPGGGGWRALDTDDIDVEHFIQQDYVAYVTDGGMIVPGEGYPHPRYYGTFARFIRRYALDRQVVKLPFMIRGMTSLAAQIIGLKDRGLLREGYYADINVFDPVSIRDRATYMNPHQYSTGFKYVLINGTLVLDDGRPTGALPGKILTGPMTDSHP